MIRHEEITVFEEKECNILDEALKTYLVELYTIKGLCRNPVYIDGDLIEKRIADVRRIKRAVHARTTKGKKEFKDGKVQVS